jgi:hypothetical protein
MALLDIFRVLEQTTLPPVVDPSVRFPAVERVVLDPVMLPTLEILNPDILKNPMLDNTMLPPVVEESVRLLDPVTVDTLKRM